VIPDRKRLLKALLDKDFDPRETVLLEEQPEEGPWEKGRPKTETGKRKSPRGRLFNRKSEIGNRKSSVCQFLRRTAEEVEIETRRATAGWLVLADPWFPSWQATVDGRPARMYRANGLVRAVPVPAGKHRVRFTYRPRAFYRGARISGTAGVLLLLGGLFVWGRRKLGN
jgi:hypothetical protein